jgi:hypothetical protein
MWIQPKTNWTKDDCFNAADFNRIKNNLVSLRDISNKMYKDFDITSMGVDKTYRDYFYADEINLIEDNFEKINRLTINVGYGEKPIYKDNGYIMTFEELNRLEGAMLDLYDKLENQSDGLRRLKFNLGKRGSDL